MRGSSRIPPRITLVISSLFHARSALESRLVETLEESFEVVVVCTEEVFGNYRGKLAYRECHFFQIDGRAESFSNRVMNAGAFRFKSRSGSFRYRIKRRIRESARFHTSQNSANFRAVLSWGVLWSKLFIDGWILYRMYLIPRYRKILDANSTLLGIFKEVKPDVVVIWSQSMEPASSSAVRSARQLSIPSILVADNWDNLFSKTVLVEKPDLVGCFGMQGAHFGAKLHGIPLENVVPLGSARFEIYRESEKLHRQRDTILYVGSSIVAEDERVLRTLLKVKNEIDTEKSRRTTLVWKYRPHPFPQKSAIDLSGVLKEFTDLHVEKRSNSDESPPLWPKLSDSVVELSQTRIAVCMPSSYLLEVRINSVEVIVPAFEDNSEVTSCKTLISSLEHLKGLSDLTGVTIAKSEAEIESSLLKGIIAPSFPPPDQTLDWFVQWSGEGFGQNLNAAVHRLLK